MKFTKMRKTLLHLQETDYRNFVKALVAIESNCIDEEKLESMYEIFMENDAAGLLDASLKAKIKFNKTTSRKDDKNEQH